MNDRQTIATHTAQALAAADLSQFPALLGFDGFVDDIVEVVDKRHDHQHYDRLLTISQFSQRTAAAAGQSCNMELVITRQKLGGNGPIMANALATLGIPLTYIGAVGDGPAGFHPVFAEFATRATLIPLAPPAHTHALEFTDGKLMLGNLAPLLQISWSRLLERIALDRLTTLFENATLIGLLNWTMLPHVTDIWRHIAIDILPRLSKQPRRLFIDLADPEKRAPSDLLDALHVLSAINPRTPVTLGLNLSEAQKVAAVLNVTIHDDLRALSADIRKILDLDMVVIHPRHGAAASTAAGTASFAGPFTDTPLISTGAGDHFNTGFALGQLLNLPLEQALCLATATSGFYVRNAHSPSPKQLANFLTHLPAPEN